MLNNQTIEHLLGMKLRGMAEAYHQQLEQSEMMNLSFEERLGLIVEHEWSKRKNNQLGRHLRMANFPVLAMIEDIDYLAKRDLNKSFIATLSQCEWIAQGLNLILTGPTGVGKTYIACALGNIACRNNLSVKYFRVSRLLEELSSAKAQGTYLRMIRSLQKCSVLILDDWGINTFSSAESRDLLDLVEDRNLKKSTIIVSQIPIEDWPQVLPDPTVADAIMDRIIHNAYRLDITGPSMRKIRSKAKAMQKNTQ